MTPASPRLCAQQCGAAATVYAMDPHPGGWGGYYCEPCATSLRFTITDRLATPTQEPACPTKT